MFLSIGMLKLNYFLADIFILSAEKQPIKLSWRKIECLQFSEAGNTFGRGEIKPAGFLKNVSGFEGKDFGLLSKTFRRFSVLMLKLFC